MARTPELPADRVEADLRRRIAAGDWAHGDALPSVGKLSAEYTVARKTIIKALRRLADDDLIRIVPNWGTFRA